MMLYFTHTVRLQAHKQISINLKALLPMQLRRKHGLLPYLCACVMAGWGNMVFADNIDTAIEHSIADVGRPQSDSAQDANCLPGSVLKSSSLHQRDAVLELVPDNGYWTRILSKIVGSEGRVYAYAPLIGPPPQSQPGSATGQHGPIDAILEIQHTAAYKNVMAILAGGASLGLPTQVNVVWVADHYHEFPKLFGTTDNADINRAVFRNLKPGGYYTVVETESNQKSDSLKSEVLGAGFVVDSESKLSANGGSARYAIRFKKPASAKDSSLRPPDSVMANYFGNTFILGNPTQRFRTVFFHPDHSRQEIGLHDMQWSTWYWDVDGNQCVYHEAPAKEEGFVTCHPFPQDHKDAKLGDVFSEQGGPGRKMTVSLVKGIVYPNSETWP